jgi:2-oxoglutarate ferredoxin oxidoreductase subunit alpha
VKKPLAQLMSGNEAIAQGALDAGCRFYAGYPITPQNELTAYMAAHMPACGGVFIQAESEIAAINMVFGASAAGARAMTSSSSPGISLKQEGISYLAGARLPSVIVNVMRGGPGLGNIAPAQSDYFQATRGGGHGDYRCIVLAPSTVQEAYEGMQDAFRLSDAYRVPVIVLADGMLGQMMEPLHRRVPARLSKPAKPWALTGCAGRAPNIARSFYLVEGELEKLNLRLQSVYRTIEAREQRADLFGTQDASVVVVAYGTMGRMARSAVRRLRAQGIKAGYCVPQRLWPFPSAALEKIVSRSKAPAFLVAEMSYGQMREDVERIIRGRARVDFLGKGGGGIIDEDELVRTLRSCMRTRT